jgi:RNAse (barnase) inhibitor barstar
MNQLLEIIQGKITPGIYELSLTISPVELSQLCQEYNCKLFYLDGERIFDKPGFFQSCLGAMDLPEYFGNNWDAWEDCLTDLSWCQASSYLLVYPKSQNFASHSPQDWAIFLDVLSSAISYWEEQKTPFSVIFPTS